MAYRYKRRRGIDKKILIILIVSVIVFLVSISAALLSLYSYFKQSNSDVPSLPEELLMGKDYIQVELLGLGQNNEIVIGTQCQQLVYPVTSDQIFSVSKGITRDFVRPLTHDMYENTLNHFEIKPVRFTIDSYENDLWYGTLRLQKGKDVLDLDIRPSDGIAMAVRYNLTINIDEDTFNEKARNVC